MKKWIRIPGVIIGAAATAYGCLYLSPLLAGFAGAATLWLATTPWGSRTPVQLPASPNMNPADVRRYREDHPGTSVEAAVRAVATAAEESPTDRAI